MPKLAVKRRSTQASKEKSPSAPAQVCSNCPAAAAPIGKRGVESQPMAPKVNEMKSAGKLLLGWLAPPTPPPLLPWPIGGEETATNDGNWGRGRGLTGKWT